MAKECRNCGATKAEEDFYFHNKVTGTRAGICKSCAIARSADQRRADPERNRQWQLAYCERHREAIRDRAITRRRERGDEVRAADAAYRDANREKITEYRRAWAAANRDDLLAKRRARYRENPTLTLATNTRWRRNNPDKWRAIGRRREALERGAEVKDFTAEQWAQRQSEFGWCCAYCLRSGPLEQDHLVPLTRGGHHTYDNIVPACRSCNAKKGNRPVWVMLG